MPCSSYKAVETTTRQDSRVDWVRFTVRIASWLYLPFSLPTQEITGSMQASTATNLEVELAVHIDEHTLLCGKLKLPRELAVAIEDSPAGVKHEVGQVARQGIRMCTS